MVSENDNPLQAARKMAYRKIIVEAAERVFAQYGFEAAKVQAIADEAGVAVGTIYSVFGSKAELFSEVLTHRLPELLQITSAAAINASTPLEALTTGLRAYIVYLLRHPESLQIHLREHAWGLGPRRATAQQLEAWRQGMELEASVLKTAIAEGLVIDVDPYVLARCITAVHQVQLWDWVEKGMVEPVEQVADRLDQVFVQMFCTKKFSE